MESPENNENETPDEAVEEVEATEAETTGEAEAAETAEPQGTTEAVEEAAEAPAPAPVVSKKEQRTQARHLEASKRPQRTPEERQTERDELRKAKAAARRRRRLQEREKHKATRTEVPPTPPVEHEHGRKKVRQGVVVSAKPDKTITVRIDVARRHPRYQKVVRSSVTLHAHDDANDAGEGDTVRIVESRPLSKSKRWRLDEVLERAR
jgi:small subunit ribosomal protein S17